MAFVISKIAATPELLKYSVHWDASASNETATITHTQLLADLFGTGPLRQKLSTPVATDADARALVVGADMDIRLDFIAAPESSLASPAALRNMDLFATAAANVLQFILAGRADGVTPVPWIGVLTIAYRHTLVR